jgi:hypothetical protein
MYILDSLIEPVSHLKTHFIPKEQKLHLLLEILIISFVRVLMDLINDQDLKD